MENTGSVSVLIRSGDLGDRLPRIVEMLDDQLLPYSRYEAVLTDPGSSRGTSDRLAELVARRPNVRVLPHDNRGWRSMLEAAHGEFVLCLGADDVLFAHGLPALLAAAADGHDMVLAGGGDSGPLGFVPESLDADHAVSPVDPSGTWSGIAALAPFALINRELLLGVLSDDQELQSFRQLRLRLLSTATAIAVCRTPVGIGTGPESGGSADEIWTDASSAADVLGDVESAAWFIAAHAAAILDPTAAPTAAPTADPTADPRAASLPTVEAKPELAARIVDVVQRQWKDRDPADLPYLQRAVVRPLAEGDLASAGSVARGLSELQLTTTSSTAEWTSGALELTVVGTIPTLPPPLDGPADKCAVRLTVRNVANQIEYDLATDATLEPAADGPVRFVARAALDVATAAAGERLDEGVWQVRARLVGVGAFRTISSPIPFSAATGAIVDGTPVSVFGADGQLRLDVGARRHGFLGTPLKPSQASISETATGALLTITAPDLAVRGDASIPSALYLGSFRLPAVLRATDSGVRLECYVSGLAGVSRLDAAVGSAVRESLGLQLRIGAAGDMAIETAVAKHAKPKAGPSKAAGRGGAGRGPNQPKAGAKRGGGKKRRRRVVDRVPEPLRPVARAAAKSPILQRAYRQILRRL